MITVEALTQVERAEAYLRQTGFRQLRVRHHGDVARLELAPDDFERALALRQEIVTTLKELGFTYVALDLTGFRSGSMNETLAGTSAATGGGAMDENQLTELLAGVQDGQVSVEQAVAQLQLKPSDDLAFANLDHNRALRTGVPEVIFCQGKTSGQVVEIVGRMMQREGRVLATRAAPEVAEAVLPAYPEAHYAALARRPQHGSLI